MSTVLELAAVSKTFRMHLQGGIRLPVVSGVAFDVKAGECAVLAGPSGAGKSSILKMIFGTYRCDSGSIVVRHGGDAVDVATAEPRQILELRRTALGYVSQFLRAVPRVAAIDVVAEPLGDCRRCANGGPAEGGRPAVVGSTSRSGFGRCRRRRSRAGSSSASISPGGSCPDLPLLLLDEPTASLDAGNRAVVVDLVAEKKRSGTAVVAIVHDEDVRTAIADTVVEVARFTPTAVERVMSASGLVLSNARVVLADRVIGCGWVAADEWAHCRDRRGGCSGAWRRILPATFFSPAWWSSTRIISRHTICRGPRSTGIAVAAVVSYDGQLATCGITTVLNSLRVWREEGAEDVDGEAEVLAEAIAAARDAELLRIDHFLHLRCEVPMPNVVAETRELIGRPDVRLLSLMDHTPGQRQFRDERKLRDYYRGKNGGMTDAELDVLFARRHRTSGRSCRGKPSRHCRARAQPRHPVGQPRRHHLRSRRRSDPRRRIDRRVSDHRRDGTWRCTRPACGS